jgi:ATP/maltotriose-dependent transcriptional regulator MalT
VAFAGRGGQRSGALRPPPGEAILTSLLNDLHAAEHTTTVVLDDYHQIHALSVHEILRYVLDYLIEEVFGRKSPET